MGDVLAPVLAAVLLAAAALKAADRAGATAALATYGLHGTPAVAAWLVATVSEALLGAALLVGVPGAGWAGGGLLLAFALVQGVALARGRGGAPCGCFGARGGLSAASLARALVLAGGCVAVALSGEAAAPAPVAAAAVAGAATAWCAQRAGWLAPRGALSVAGEGPDVGARLALGSEEVALFVSPDCRLCKRLLRGLDRDVAVYDEIADAGAWAQAGVPGAPFAIVLRDGVVQARGTVNTAAQLRSLVAEAERRRLEAQAESATGEVEATPTRRTLLAQAAGVAAAAVGARALIRPGEAEAYHFCGHIYTTDSCPHPTGLPRIDAQGYPLRARDGHRVDDLGRPVDDQGRPLDDDGALMTDAEGRPLPPATRTRVCTATARRYGFKGHIDGAWYRCCRGRVRKLVDCCGNGRRRINGDAALTGYCYRGRRVFCVMYFDTRVKC